MAHWPEIETLLADMIAQQHSLLLTSARRVVPTVIADDLLQPNDFPELEQHAPFRYEEGYLAGLLAMQAALRALQRDLEP
jgi:hypothetical protein